MGSFTKIVLESLNELFAKDINRPLDRNPEDPSIHVFVPGHKAAKCLDCGGYFIHHLGSCPGCGSKQYHLTEPTTTAPWMKKK